MWFYDCNIITYCQLPESTTFYGCFLTSNMYNLSSYIFLQTEHLLPNGDLLVHHHGNSSHVYSCMGELQTTNATLSQYELHTVTPITTLTPHTTVQVHNSLPILLTGDTSTLVCTYERQNSSCDQPSMPRWYHNGREMNAAELVHAGHVIRLERVGVADAGVYCCVVEGVESCTTLDIVERSEYVTCSGSRLMHSRFSGFLFIYAN